MNPKTDSKKIIFAAVALQFLWHTVYSEPLDNKKIDKYALKTTQQLEILL